MPCGAYVSMRHGEHNADKRGYVAINLRSSAFICGFFIDISVNFKL
jgi:hypothetical protein